VQDARFYHPTLRLDRWGMAPDYLSPRPVEWFKGNRQDQHSGIGIGRAIICVLEKSAVDTTPLVNKLISTLKRWLIFRSEAPRE
jgi:hypothetical protein